VASTPKPALRGSAVLAEGLRHRIGRGIPRHQSSRTAAAVTPQRLLGSVDHQRRAAAIGLDPERFAGHSLRAGLATSAAAAGASERAIMTQTGHRSSQMVRRYICDDELFRPDNAAAVVGL
jgi:integrase